MRRLRALYRPVPIVPTDTTGYPWRVVIGVPGTWILPTVFLKRLYYSYIVCFTVGMVIYTMYRSSLVMGKGEVMLVSRVVSSTRNHTLI